MKRAFLAIAASVLLSVAFVAHIGITLWFVSRRSTLRMFPVAPLPANP